MTLCRVVGTVVASAGISALAGRKLLVCRPTGKGSEMIAVDTVQAGEGDLVLVCDEGNAARLILCDREAPIRTVVVAVVDEVAE